MVRAALFIWVLCQLPLPISQQPAPAPAKGGHQPQRDSSNKGESAKGDQPTAHEPTSTRLVIPTSATKPETAETTHQHENAPTPERGLMYATWALVAITGGLAIFTAKLWGATKALAEDAKKSSDRQAGEVRESLTIGRETVRAMEVHSERRLRAYVTVTSGRIVTQDRRDGTWSLNWYPRIDNTGQTPARDVMAWVGVAVQSLPLPKNMDFSKFGPDSPFNNPVDKVSRTTIGAGMFLESNYALDRFIPDSEMRDLRQSGARSAVYICGTIAYQDIFRQPHRTDFCIYAVWPASGLGDPEGRYTEQHNDID